MRERFGDYDISVVPRDEPSPCDLTLYLTQRGVPGFGINQFRTGGCVSCDGTLEQQAEVAAMATTLFPAPLVGRVWLIDQGYFGHAVLTPGMSPTTSKPPGSSTATTTNPCDTLPSRSALWRISGVAVSSCARPRS